MKRHSIALLTSSALVLAPAAAQINPGPQVPNSNGATGGGGGGVSQVNTSCGVSGGPITSSGTVQGATLDNTARSFSGTTDTVANGDCGLINDYTNTAAVAVTVPSPSGFTIGYSVTIKSNGSNTGGVTLTPSGTTIDGSSGSIAIATGSSLDLYVNSSGAWGTIFKPGSGGASFANPTATAGPNANNGSATTAMRSDASPAVQLGSASQAGLIQCGANTSCSGGTMSVPGPAGSSGQQQVNNGSGGFSALASNANMNHPGYSATINGVTAWWVPISGNPNQANGNTPAVGTTYCSPGLIGGTSLVTINGLGTLATTAGSSNIQLAIYANDTSPTTGSSYAPGALIDSTPSIANNTTSSQSANLNSTHQIAPGLYWFCLQTDDTVYRSKVYSTAAILNPMQWIGQTSPQNAINNANGGGLSIAGGSFGTWPATFHGNTFGSTATGTAPVIVFSLASVP